MLKKRQMVISVLLVPIFLHMLPSGIGYAADVVQTSRQRDDEVLLFNDSEYMDMYYHQPAGGAASEIEVYLYVGDGPISLGDPVRVEPDETVLNMKTDASDLFTPGVYSGAIIVRSIDTGLISERIHVSIRIYERHDDPYDSILEPESEHELVLDSVESSRKEYYEMLLYLHEGTVMIDFSGLMAQNRSLDLEIVAFIEEQEIPIARVEHIGPRSLCLSSDVLAEALPLLKVGAVYEARLDSHFSDTDELFETRAGEIVVLN